MKKKISDPAIAVEIEIPTKSYLQRAMHGCLEYYYIKGLRIIKFVLLYIRQYTNTIYRK
jgi:hypothetical protein